MKSFLENKYKHLSDKDIVDKIVTQPYNEEAAAYLIYNRYHPLLIKIYHKVYGKDIFWYEDCQNDLFDYLKGKGMDWQKLRSFEWRSHFSAWIGRTANNRFLEIKPYLIGKIPNPISIDDDDNEKSPVQLPDGGVEDYETTQRKILLMEAIRMLEDSDQRFVVLKRLQGYSSKEIAELMQQSWDKHGIVRMDKGKRVIPTPGYVDVRMQRAKEELRKLIVTID